MPKVISSLAEADPRGIFIAYQKAIAAAKAIGTARAAMVCQLPWGPLDSETAYETPGVFRSQFAPDGFDRTGAAYNCAVKFPWADLQIVRILGASPAKATIDLQKTGPANCVTAPAKYYGAAGNGITCVVADATNAVANSFDLTVTKTNASTGRATVEKYVNVDSTKAAGTYWTNLTAKSLLLGPLVKNASGRPANGTYTLAAGSDGSAVTATDYLGTPGSADHGVALLEKDKTVSFVFCDDVGASILATVNTGLAAHATLMRDRRFVLINGNPAETESTAKTNAALNQGDHVVYTFPHGKVVDEDAVSDTSALLVVPLTAALASIATLMQPHLSPAFKRKDFTRAMKAIKELDAGTGTSKSLAALEAAGVLPFEQNSDGVFSPYGSTCTDASSSIMAGRMADFLSFSIAEALDDFRNGPNDDVTIEDERTIAGEFLAGLVRNRKRDHIFLPCLDSAGLLDTDATNTQASLDAGDYTLGFEGKIISEQKRIILSGKIGTTVTVTGTTLG